MKVAMLRYADLCPLLGIALGISFAGAATASEAPELCSPYTGFSTVGTVWEYALRTTLYEGWERSELTSLDTASGDVQVRTTGGYATDGFTYTFDRTEDYLCDVDGLRQFGWSSAWTLTNDAGEFSISGTLTATWYTPMLLLALNPEVGDTWEHHGPEVGEGLTLTTDDGDVITYREYYAFEVDPVEELTLLGTTIPALPVVGVESGMTTWYAEDYGVVARNGLILESYTPGTGTATPSALRSSHGHHPLSR